jgi:hypothetical protein
MDGNLASLLYAIDWHNTWRPAALLLLSGRSPYDCKWFFGPPWAIFPLLPLALLPETIGRLILLLLCFILFALAALRLGAGRLSLIIFLLSPVVLHSLSTGNLDALVLFGAVLPPWLGLFFVSVKPQMGLPLALFWAVEAWRVGGYRRVVGTFAPVSLALSLSFALYGLWPLRATSLAGSNWNASLWPWSIPIGLALLARSLKRRRPSPRLTCACGPSAGSPGERPALAAGPFISPYVSFQSYSACLLALVDRPRWLCAASAGLWALVAISAYT